MDERPELLSEAVDDAAVIDTIDVGGGDTIVVTRETTHVYRSDGRWHAASIERFDHDIDRLSIKTKRGKSSIKLERIDGEESFTIPSKVVDEVLEAMIQGVLLTNGVLDGDEDVSALFRFSELTLVVTDRRLFKHVGSAVWDSDFEAVAYADLAGIDFERGDVGTQVILETSDRRRRVKVPNEHAGTVKREIQTTVCAFYGVDSMEALRDELADPDDSGTETDGIAVDNADSSGPDESSNGLDGSNGEDDFVSAGWSPAADSEPTGNTDPQRSTRESETDGVFDDGAGSERAEIDALADRVDALSKQIERQTELIESQQELIEQLVDELRRGR